MVFPWGPIFEFGNNYRPFFPQGRHVRVRKKCLKPVVFPRVPFLSQVKFYGKVVAQSLLSIFIHFLIFIVNKAQYNTHTAHTIHNTQPHTAYKTHNASARHITSHDIT